MANNYDVVIIGSRAGGGTLARQLAPSGKNVLILERADSLKREAENWDGTSVFVKNRYISPETFKSGFNIGFDIQTTKVGALAIISIISCHFSQSHFF